MPALRRAVCFLVVLAAGACGPPSKPCTTCPDVQGTYHFVAPATQPEQSSCRSLYFSGIDEEVTILQTGSKLLISAFPGEATLYDSLSIDLPRMDIQTSDGDPGYLTVTGSFGGSSGRRSLSVRLAYRATLHSEYDDVDCSLTVTGRMTQTVK